MSWIELNLETTNEAVDWVYTLLAKAIAAEDIHIRELESQNVSSEEKLTEDQWTFSIQIYLPEDAQSHQKIQAIAAILNPLHRTGMTSELQTFVIEQKPQPSNGDFRTSLTRKLGDRFVILRSASEDGKEFEHDQRIPLRLSSSLAFGTGLHPATILSLRLIERYVQPSCYALDLGSGSGILSVAMAKLGATVLAIDNDPIAAKATLESVRQNQVESQVSVQQASLGSASNLGHWMGVENLEPVPAIAADGQFDLIVANIFARVHISLAAEFYQALRNQADHTGILITSGYTSDRQDDIDEAMAAVGFHPCERLQIEEWAAIAYQKPTN